MITNYEYYKDKIMETDRGIPIINGVPNFNGCVGMECRDCLRGVDNFCSDAKYTGWLMSEYEDHTDWANVPVDTPIFVKEPNWDEWIPRHFAKYEDGKIYAWVGGSTSHTADNVNNGRTSDGCYTEWSMVKLAKEEGNNE